MRRNYKSSKGKNLTAVEGMYQFAMYILEVVQPARRGRSIRRGGGGEGGKLSTALGRICAGVCSTRVGLGDGAGGGKGGGV